MGGIWVLVALAVFGVIAKTIGWWGHRSDLGFVSRHWLAERHFN
jgi:hypothetical protein